MGLSFTHAEMATQCDEMLYTFDPEFVYDFATEGVTISCGRNP